MTAGHLRRMGALGAIAALGVTGLVSTGARAESGDADRAESSTITMEAKGKELFFEGPRSIDRGNELEIVNDTDTKQIGPHTFSLIEKDLYPELSKEAIKACFKKGVCLRIAKAHKVDFKTEEIGRIVARVGKEGWDTSFGRRGDSWFSLEQDESFSQKVSAKAGSTLYYFCAIHPEMQGKIKVR